MTEKALIKAQRWIIKVGSSLVTNDGCSLNHDVIRSWAAQIAQLTNENKQVMLVTSGSIADGISKLGWNKRPRDLHHLQAAAAIGQMGLMEAYHEAFSTHGIHTAQVLMTHEDFKNHQRYLNARATLTTLLKMNVVPVINENDSISTEEIQIGDNDTMAAHVANLADADVLLILTDQQGLFDRDPRMHDDAKLIEKIDHDDPLLDDIAGPSATEFGRGGMITKIAAARQAKLSGTSTIIAGGNERDVITDIAKGKCRGTYLKTDAEPQALRKRWIMNLKPRGTLTLDEGACRALESDGSSLLPVGVTAIDGHFEKGDMVVCQNEAGVLIAYGLSNYSHKDAQRIIGKNSDNVKALMGEVYEPELIHRDNLVRKTR